MRYIYVIRNLTNEKVYVGQTINPAQRKAGHFCAARSHKSDRPLYRSMHKHGIENFRFEVIEECATQELTDEREKFWIAHYDSTSRERGYNISRGGQSTSQAQHRKLSEALKGNTHRRGKRMPESAKELVRQANLGRPMHPKVKEAFMRRNLEGRPHSEESKKKIGRANSITQRGSQNSQFGTVWIIKDGVSKKIHQDQLETFIASGWVRGRKILRPNRLEAQDVSL